MVSFHEEPIPNAKLGYLCLIQRSLFYNASILLSVSYPFSLFFYLPFPVLYTLRVLSRFARSRSVRGPITQQVIHTQLQGSTFAIPPVMYDPGLLARVLLPPKTQLDEETINIEEEKRKQRWKRKNIATVVLNVGLSPVHPIYYEGSTDSARQHTVQVFGRLASAMAADGIGVIFVPAWIQDVKANKDAASLAKKTLLKLKSVDPTSLNAVGSIKVISKVPTIVDLLILIEQADVVIGMRLHMSVFAFAMETSYVAVAYRLKTFDWSASVGMVNNVNVIALDAMNHTVLYDMARRAAFNPVMHAHMVAQNEAARVMWRRFRSDVLERSGKTSMKGLGENIQVGICENMTAVVFL